MYGYNGVLVGLALTTFLAPGPLLWAYVVLGAAVSVVVMLGSANAVKSLGVSALTFPFVLTTWLLLLATYGFAGLAGNALPVADMVAPFEPVAATRLGVGDFVQGVLLSISQVFLKGSVVAALLLLAGLAVNSLAAAIAALGGAIIAVDRGASARRGKRSDHGRPARLQSGLDGDRARAPCSTSRARVSRFTRHWGPCSR